jgi:pimeloyl-ACP methyl ester carboxylesterase
MKVMHKYILLTIKLFKTKILCLVLFLGSIPVCYAQITQSYPPPGKLVEAGGHLLHINVLGKGKPVVIMEGGSGDFSFIWNLVQPEIAKTTTAVSYDRAGFAWSEEGPLPRTGRQIAYELHTALHNAGITGPYILVGQSFGGFLVRSFARFYKNEVAGVVLVDALNEDSKIIINNKAVRIRDWAKGEHAPEPKNTVKRDTASADKKPVVPDTTIEPPLDKLPKKVQQMQIWAQSQPVYRKAAGDEMNWSPEDVADMYANKGKPGYMLGDIPLIVLSRGNGGYSGMPDSAQLEDERLKLQIDLSHLSTNSKHVIDKNSGHNIHLEDPALVIDAINQVIHASKTHEKLRVD